MAETQTQQLDGISATKSLTAAAGDARLVTLTVQSERDDTMFVRLADRIPAQQSLVDPSRGSNRPDRTGYNDGRLVVERVLRPGEEVTIGYLLMGEAPELPELMTELATEVTSNTDRIGAAVVLWERADGSTVPLRLSRPEETPTGIERGLPLVHLDGDVTESHSLPAVGIVLTERNEDAVYRTVMRAKRRGHPVMVTYPVTLAGSEMVEMLESLGVTVVEPLSDEGTVVALHRALSTAARERGFPGLVLQTRDCPRIDYERTLDALERSDFETIAIPESWRESSQGPAVVVGIPAYNAANSIGRVVEQVMTFADEVVVVDDGSRDDTAGAARAAGATVVVHERNRGYGGALKTVFREADARNAAHLVVIDADGQHNPADIPLLVATQDDKSADIVIGSRYAAGSQTDIPFTRSIGLAVINNLTNASLGNLRPSGWIRDTQSGYRAYNRRAIRSLAGDDAIGENMGASTDILYHAHRNRLSITEVGTTIYYDVENSSSQDSLSHGVDLVRNIVWTIEYGRPLLIVGLPGVVSTVTGVFVTVLLMTQYVQDGQLASVPLVTSVLFALGGVLLCFAAILMHVLNNHPTFRRFSS
ncbi:glycosyltransferase family 2 protein [Haloarcula sp. GH36]|uniref:glycosyltransferase family 2 protein n=1 Tax=Haloarcula montana TaxID=3111776 RepID=UPI002D769DC6|nr:glycosyltransferase family 2 protein [Haloarcula sp. GH36]